MVPLILASSSPRRKELLSQAQLSFQIFTSDVDESFDPLLPPQEIVMELGLRKARAVAKEYPNAYVLGSDTIVVYEDEILGKPKNDDEAIAMLRKLSGRSHYVFSGVAIISPTEEKKFYEKTEVEFWELTDEEIRNYVSTGEPLDKAGAYGIQGFGSLLVKKINGDYYSVVGLPLARTIRELQKIGYPTPFSK